LITQALALANWHATHQHCPRCGTPTVVEQGGWVRRCFKDDHQIFPRTDPAIIVNVVDSNDRLLLGGHPAWEENRWSILAGFVEPGESLTAAVEREIFEEAGVRVRDPHYLGSQSWPFPYSLMCGFTASLDETHHADADAALTPDGEEISRLRWITREELIAEAQQLKLPSANSIARALIEHWLGQKIAEGSAN
jgi:NAD+ diphosphatase